MSWKAVELQVALPRTQDAGQLQDQMNQRGQLTQEQLAQAQMKQAELKRKQVLETNEGEKINNSDDKEKNKQSSGSHTFDKGNSAETIEEEHPYLGKIIDYSG